MYVSFSNEKKKLNKKVNFGKTEAATRKIKQH